MKFGSGSADHSREVRLGLVMYGGISLAIYIYGVAQEFFNAVRGRGVFKLIKALTDSDIVVDVISGSSAGGINGILLSYCLTNELEIGEAASVWRDQGGIEAMLRDPSHDKKFPSVLRGDDYFLQKLDEAFNSLRDHRLKREPDQSELRELDLFVTGTDVDGRISTRFDAVGEPIDVKDHRVVFHLKHRSGRKEPFEVKPNKGSAIDAKSEIVCKALSKLARVTSSFPAAFEPVEVLDKQILNSPDGQLTYWGWGPAGVERNSFLIDGGVLDNKPFAHTIREIFHRLSEREVERWLFYVEPDPEVFEKLAKVNAPSVVSVALNSLSSIPSYESIVDDLNQLDEHNERVARFRRLVDFARAGAGPRLDEESAAFVEAWRRWEKGEDRPTETLPEDVESNNAKDSGITRDTKVSKDAKVEKGAATDKDAQPSPYARTRLVDISERVVRGILRADGRDTLLNEEQRRKAARLRNAYDRWPGTGDFTLYNFDVDFRIRRLFHVLYTCPKAKVDEDAQPLRLRRHALNRQLKLLEIIRAAFEKFVDEGNFHWDSAGGSQTGDGSEELKLWRYQVADAFVFLLHAEGILPKNYGSMWKDQPSEEEQLAWLSQDELEIVRKALDTRVELAKKYLEGKEISKHRPPAKLFRSILTVTDDCEQDIIARIGKQPSCDLARKNGEPQTAERTLANEYDGFIELDAALYPLQALSGLHERDIIKTVRISPRGAQRGFSRRRFDKKISGDTLVHFGGFLKRSWRANDILWGRLDGVCKLTDTLLKPDRIKIVMEAQSKREALQKLNTKEIFPNSPESTHDELSRWLAELASGAEADRLKALAEERFAAMVELLIEAQQLEVLHIEVPRVVAAAAAEQMEWNQLRIASRDPRDSKQRQSDKNKSDKDKSNDPKYDAGTDSFYRPGGGDFDPLVVTAASIQFAKEAVEDLKKPSADNQRAADPKHTALGRFFLKQYDVGAEEIGKHIPTSVLLQVLSTTLLVTRNCLLEVLGEERQKAVRRNPLYRLVSLMLWAFDGSVALMRRGALHVITIIATLTLLSGGALYVGTNWWNEIVSPAGVFSIPAFVCFIGIPVIVIGCELWLLINVAWSARDGSGNSFETWHPLGGIPSRCSRPLIVVLLIITAVCFGLIFPDRGLQMELLRQAGVNGGPLGHYWFVTLIDTAFLIAYTCLLSVSSFELARCLRASGTFLWPLGTLLAWVALLAGAVDLVENLAIMALLCLKTVPQDCVCQVVFTAGRFCSDWKLLLPGIVVGGLVALPIWLMVKRALLGNGRLQPADESA